MDEYTRVQMRIWQVKKVGIEVMVKKSHYSICWLNIIKESSKE